MSIAEPGFRTAGRADRHVRQSKLELTERGAAATVEFL
jgi:hypothetical protein